MNVVVFKFLVPLKTLIQSGTWTARQIALTGWYHLSETAITTCLIAMGTSGMNPGIILGWNLMYPSHPVAKTSLIFVVECLKRITGSSELELDPPQRLVHHHLSHPLKHPP